MYRTVCEIHAQYVAANSLAFIQGHVKYDNNKARAGGREI